MNEQASERFDSLSPAQQHAVETWVDQLSRRDTVVDAQLAATAIEPEDEARDSQVYAIPSAANDRRGAMAVMLLLIE